MSDAAKKDVVQVEDRGAVRIIAINRPESRNAINMDVLLGLRKARNGWRLPGAAIRIPTMIG
jgi:enoyl-CoA hydratase/carnithine racemase